MKGDVTSYNSSTGELVVDVTLTQGSGSYSSWSVFTIPKTGVLEELTAGEDLSARDPVSINSEDGKVYKFRHYSEAFSEDFPGGSVAYFAVARLDDTHIVAAYADSADGYKGKVVVGTVSDRAVSWGTAVTFNDAETRYIDIVALTSTTFVIAYSDYGNNQYGTAIVGTVSGTSISLGSETVFWNSGGTGYESICRLDDTHCFIGFSGTDGSNQYVRSVVGGVSGTSISFGTVVTAANTNDVNIRTAPLDSTHVVIQHRSGLRIAEISGTTITYPTAETSVSDRYALASLDSTHFVSFESSSYNITARLYSVSGTTITEEDSQGIVTGIGTWPHAAFQIDSSRVAVLFTYVVDSVGQNEAIALVTCSSSEITDWEVELNAIMDPTQYKDGCMIDDCNYIHVAYGKYQIQDIGLVFSALAGFVNDDITSGNDADVYYSGVMTGFSSLSPGRTYNLDGDGTLKPSSKTPEPETNYRAGIAKSATELLIQL